MQSSTFQSKSLLRLVASLALSTMICAGLIWYRMREADSTSYLWLIRPNLLLAWIPLGIALAIRTIWSIRQRITIALVPLGFLWLLFLPNAPYMVTDLVHLIHIKENMPVHFDLLVNALSAFTALIIGFVSLYMLHDMIKRSTHSVIGWLFSLGVLLLSSLGVFLGRFLRWNSWDVFSNPQAIFQDTFHLLQQSSSLFFIGVFALFVISMYLVFYQSFRLHE